MISLFDMFKVGIGPSSSHTVGPMVAAKTFLDDVVKIPGAKARMGRIAVTLFGSLAATGIGHGTDKAVVLGLLGCNPRTLDPESVDGLIKKVVAEERLQLMHFGFIPFKLEESIIFEPTVLEPAHPNALHFLVVDHDGMMLASDTFYSIGGGFVQRKGEEAPLERSIPPHVFLSANRLLDLCDKHETSIDQLMLENELSWHSAQELSNEVGVLWNTMKSCVDRGLHSEGVLPGGLNLPRRAPKLFARLTFDDTAKSEDNAEANNNKLKLNRRKTDQSEAWNPSLDFYSTIDWVNAWALAVNEENAAGGRVVTAPTNGAAGIVPAVLMFASKTVKGFDLPMVQRFLLTATAFGYLFKQNASISGAEVGCQGEVGSACAMAASGLACLMGGSPTQIENAAEIATEHNLGLTCDPVAGLVQVPCIERNAIAAVKAINAARMALLGDGQHFVSFDKVVKTLRETGADMQTKYKETSQGGLAVNTIEC